MLKKEEVYVRVSSKKKARKLKELLEMFGEKVYADDSVDEALERGWGLHHDGQEWLNISSNRYNKTKVSLKELRNILEFEHNDEKKELEIGKWYKHPKGSIYFINHECERGHLYGYGFDEKGNWDVKHQSDSRYCAFNSVAKYDITEAPLQEVEEALIKEAKRRYKVGDLIEKISEWNIGNYPCDNKENSFKIIDVEDIIYSDNILSYGNLIVFKNDKWAEVIKPEKSLEERIKELEDVVFKATINCICRDKNGKLVAKVDGRPLEIVLERNKR